MRFPLLMNLKSSDSGSLLLPSDLIITSIFKELETVSGYINKKPSNKVIGKINEFIYTVAV